MALRNARSRAPLLNLKTVIVKHAISNGKLKKLKIQKEPITDSNKQTVIKRTLSTSFAVKNVIFSMWEKQVQF